MLGNDPIINLAGDLQSALGVQTERFSELLLSALAQLVKVQGGQIFGLCRACHHFDEGGGKTARRPHRCALLEAGLSETNGDQICVEQEPVT